LFSFSRKSGDLAPFHNGSAITDFFERTSTPFIAYTGSNVTMGTMADAGVSSGAVNDAPFEDVSKFLLGMVSFLQTAPRPTAARWCAQIKVLREVPGRSRLLFGT
jgi:hypothetical protein